MDINIGDKVKFLNDTGGGSVTQIINNEQVYVITDEGFEFPVATQELLLEQKGEEEERYNTLASKEEGSSQPQEEEEEEAEEEDNFDTLEDIADQQAEQYSSETDPETLKENEDIRILLALVPKEQKQFTEGNLELYLINDSNYKLLYTLANNQSGRKYEYDTLDAGFLEANTKIFIREFTREELNTYPDLLFQSLSYKKDHFIQRDPTSKAINIQPLKLYDKNNYTENEYFDEKAYILHLDTKDLKQEYEKISNEEIQQILQQKQANTQPVKRIQLKEPTGKRRIKQPPREIDLHIHELVDDERGLSDSDKLELQLVHFQKKLNEAINNKEKKIVFIHGTGNGRLKHEIRRIIDGDYPNVTYQDASFQEYGFGATLVLIK